MGFFDAKYEKRIVCFIDILGFANIIKRTTKPTSSINFDLQNIVNALEFVHRHFAELNLDYGGMIQLSQFSDSIVISFTMKNKRESIAIFKNIKYVQVELLSQFKILMRGGIVIGEIIHKNDLLLGPAMIDAYILESKCAMSPRIVIDPKVSYYYRKELKELSTLGIKEDEIIISKDFDGTSYIDYFNFYDIDFFLNAKPEAYFTTICEIIRDNVNSSDISIRVKYLWMRNKLKNSLFYNQDIKYKNIYKRIVTDGEERLV